MLDDGENWYLSGMNVGMGSDPQGFGPLGVFHIPDNRVVVRHSTA